MSRLAVLLVIVAACGDLAGCGGALPPASDQAIVAEEEASELACVAEPANVTRSEIDACRCQVKHQYHRPCATADGGAHD